MTLRTLKTRWKEAGLFRHCNHPSTVRAEAKHFDLAWWTIETVMLILDYVAGPTTETSTSCSTWCGSEFAAFAVVLLHLPATVVFYRPGRWMKEVQNVPIKFKFFNLWIAANTNIILLVPDDPVFLCWVLLQSLMHQVWVLRWDTAGVFWPLN